jgi:hypothetical protein
MLECQHMQKAISNVLVLSTVKYRPPLKLKSPSSFDLGLFFIVICYPWSDQGVRDKLSTFLPFRHRHQA